MRSCAWFVVVGVLCGCPGDPVEGQGTAGSDGASSTGNDDDSATISASASNTITVGSQSATDTTDSGITITSAETNDPTGDPTSATLDETGTTASDTIGETTIATDDPTTTLSAGTSESTDTGVCVENDEPNQDEATAWDQGIIACNAADFDVLAVADAATTPDWYAYAGSFSDDVTCGSAYALPRAEIVEALGLEVCLFVACPVGLTTEVACAGVAVPSNSPVGGLPGCCATDLVDAVVNCYPSGDESATVLVSVGSPVSACQDYTLRLSY